MRVRETVGAIAVAVAIAGVGGAAVYAATDTPTRSWGDGPHDGPARRGATEHTPTPVHSESVTPGPGGEFITEITQVGRITQLTPTSVTVLSSDGYRQTYRLPVNGVPIDIAPLAVEEHIQIRGTRTADTTTATSIEGPRTGEP